MNWGGGYDKHDVGATAKARHDEYNVLSFHLFTHFLCPFVSILWGEGKKTFIFFLHAFVV